MRSGVEKGHRGSPTKRERVDKDEGEHQVRLPPIEIEYASSLDQPGNRGACQP